jgi:hypothetical protein
MSMREQIIELLGCGLSNMEVATAVGCDPSWISQLLALPEVFEQVQILRAARTRQFVEHDAKIDRAEAAVLDRVMHLANFVTKPGEAAKVFSILNSAKRRAVSAPQDASNPSTVVNINLPQTMAVAIQVSQDKQVIEVNGRSMTTMPAKNVAAALESKKTRELLELQMPKKLTLAGQF